jgi:uncharacterized protein YndB with AHSA1/START domain
MTPAGGPLVVERHIQAAPETVFGFFADPRRWLQWQGLEAELDPRPGGVFRMNVRGDGWATGRFLEVDPPRRIVFTWGWEIERSPLPPGTSVVEVELIPQDGGTLIRSPTTTCPSARSPPTRPAGPTTWTGWPSAPAAATPAPTPCGSTLEPTPTRWPSRVPAAGRAPSERALASRWTLGMVEASRPSRGYYRRPATPPAPVAQT